MSFKEKSTLNLLAASLKEFPDNLYSPHFVDNTKILKSLGIYGPNSSGKSNVIKAFSFMRNFVLNSSKESNASQPINAQPFRLSSTSDNVSSSFEVSFLLNETKYTYGFIVNDKYVEGEWLSQTIKRKEETIFLRAQQEFQIENKRFKEELKNKATFLAEFTRSNSLFLSVLSQFNMPISQSITRWFSNCIVAHDTDHLALIDFTAKLMSNQIYRKLLNDLIKNSGLGIDGIEEKIKELSSKSDYSSEFLSSVFDEEIKNYTVKTKHTKYDENLNKTGSVLFDLAENESLGTQKYFGLLGPILLALKEQRILFIDEMDARLHTHLLESVLELFNSQKHNPNGAQLIFTSHNTNMLKKKLRRDQMVFVEKDEYGVSYMESLYKKSPKTRNDASFDKDYLLGKYGAIPNIPPSLASQLNLFEK